MRPIKFRPLLKQTLWGGDRIVGFKRIDDSTKQVGESWEVSGVKGHESIVLGGDYDGLNLTELVGRLRENLVGKANYNKFGNHFPLLIKFIDAGQNLSVQVHPDDRMARKYGLENGKTEMWYVMDSAPGAQLMCGLKQRITPEEYKAMVADGSICDAVAKFEVKDGDCFFIPGGRIHSIGKGCFLAEIQQTSDTTYRIYDYKRKDKDGNYRQLHTEKAAECIDYSVEDDYRTLYKPAKDRGVSLVRCDKFNTSVYNLDKPLRLDYSALDSFVILIGVKGIGTFADNEGNVTTLREGETMLVPATTATLDFKGELRFLETYV